MICFDLCFGKNNEYVYEFTMTSNNPYAYTVWATLTATAGQGYFVSNTVPFPTGSLNQTVYFYPLSGFIGGNVGIKFLYDIEDGTHCIATLDYDFPTCPVGNPLYTYIKNTIANLLWARIANPLYRKVFLRKVM